MQYSTRRYPGWLSHGAQWQQSTSDSPLTRRNNSCLLVGRVRFISRSASRRPENVQTWLFIFCTATNYQFSVAYNDGMKFGLISCERRLWVTSRHFTSEQATVALLPIPAIHGADIREKSALNSTLQIVISGVGDSGCHSPLRTLMFSIPSRPMSAIE